MIFSLSFCLSLYIYIVCVHLARKPRKHLIPSFLIILLTTSHLLSRGNPGRIVGLRSTTYYMLQREYYYTYSYTHRERHTQGFYYIPPGSESQKRGNVSGFHFHHYYYNTSRKKKETPTDHVAKSSHLTYHPTHTYRTIRRLSNLIRPNPSQVEENSHLPLRFPLLPKILNSLNLFQMSDISVQRKTRELCEKKSPVSPSHGPTTLLLSKENFPFRVSYALFYEMKVR